jgi:hypothetical protein
LEGKFIKVKNELQKILDQTKSSSSKSEYELQVQTLKSSFIPSIAKLSSENVDCTELKVLAQQYLDVIIETKISMILSKNTNKGGNS